MSGINIRNKTISINGKPQLLLSGEVHYFRLDRDVWRDRLEKLKAAGCNTVASYIPWLCHEPEYGRFDLTGDSRANLDLGAFIDLAHELGLWFIARPGPFIMAEMKNEGLPFYLYKRYPEIVPVSWDGTAVSSRTVDYLAPNYLAAVGTWYDQVMPVLASRLLHHGGNIIAVQLDNEVGMLSWVTKSPDLTDLVIDDFWQWLAATDGTAARDARYPFADDSRADAIRSPQESWAGPLMHDLARYMRGRFARYVAALRTMAEERGVRDVPFIVNIHGTEAGGGAPYPIGISQLYEAYTQASGYISGSDHYLGDLTLANAPDWYLMNAYQDSVNLPDQPLTSVEFEAGEGDYGSSMGARIDPSSLPLKLRMAVAQGNRLINYYLFTGGLNYRMDSDLRDGNNRISFTGERHGIGAPVNPEGVLSYTYPALSRVNTTLAAMAGIVGEAVEDHDNVAMAFVPDMFATECINPTNPTMTEIERSLRRTRFGGPGHWLPRAFFQATVRYGAIDIQHQPLLPATTPVLALASTRYMAAAVQQKLVEYVHAGGRLLAMGELPLMDMTGAPCRVLLEALGLSYIGERWSDPATFLSVTPGLWAESLPEWRAGWAQTFAPVDGHTLLPVYDADEAAGFDLRLGQGRAIVITAEIPLQMTFVDLLLAELGIDRRLQHTSPQHNIFLTSTTTPAGASFIHALNLDGFDKSVQILQEGEPLFDGRELTLRRRDGVMLPLNVAVGDVVVNWSTAEIVAVSEGSLIVRLTGPSDAVQLTTSRQVVHDPMYTVEAHDDQVLITANIGGHGDETMTVRWV